MMLAYCFFGCSLIFLFISLFAYMELKGDIIPWTILGCLLFLMYGGVTYTAAEKHQAHLECTTHQQIEEK